MTTKPSMTTTQKHGRKLRRLAVSLVLTLVALGAFVSWRLSDARNALPELRTVEIAQRDLVITVGTTGTIEPDEVIQVGPDVAGKIVSFGRDAIDPSKSIDVGSRVSKNAILFQIDTQQYDIALQKAKAANHLAEADLGRLNAQLQQASRTMDRANRLRATNAQSDYDEITTAHEMAAAQLEVGKARVEQSLAEVRHAEVSLANTTVRSPIDGVVIDRRANLGQHVSIGHPGLFLLAPDLKQMRIRAAVSESDIGKIKLGQSVSFSIDANRDRKLTGKVDEILLNARMHGNFVTYDVIVRIDPTDVQLMPHMTADVEFEVIRRNHAWLVPTGAIQWQPEVAQLDATQLDATQLDAAQLEAVAQQNTLSALDNPAEKREGDLAQLWIPSGGGKVRPVSVRVGIDDGVFTEVVGIGLTENQPVVVGVVKRTTLARIIPTAKTIR